MIQPWWLAALLLIFIGQTSVVGWNIALSITSQADGAYGGEPFSTQPVVIVNNKNGDLQTLFEGTMTVETHASPTGKFEPVWKEGEAAPTTASDTFVSETVVDGEVAFTGLGIDAAGIGYQLKFVLYDEHGLIMGTAIGDEFTVNVGEMYQLGIIIQPEMAYGGSVFGSQPLLAVQDRGRNTVADVNEGLVAAVFQTSPMGSTLRCTDDSGFSVPVTDGLVNFQGLFINEAGKHYSLHFSTDLMLDGQTEVTSNEFSVGVGPASDILLINDASDGSVFGGKAFAPQPRVEVHDAGGNVLVTDSSSAIRVSFYSNPSGGKISPVSGATELLEEGVVQFRSLSIDKAGVGYRLTYAFLQYDHEKAHLEDTSIYINGLYFNVDIGPPHQLSILQHSSGGWAGNQPFPVQAKVALLDAGGNIVLGDSASTVTAHVTPSLAHNSRVIIDTSNDPIPSVTEVVFVQSIRDEERVSYGPGDVIQIDVIFSQEVALFQTIDDGALPQIILNAFDSGGSDPVYGELILPQQGLFSRIVSFKYLVAVGHTQTVLDYLSSDSSLLANDYSIEDAFGRNADLNLPATGSVSSLSGSKVIGISDDRPIVESVTAELPTGEYGAGDEVNFILNFDRHVSVTNGPGLPLNVQSSIAVIDVSTTGLLLPGSYFNVLYKGEQSERIPWNASSSDVKHALESLSSVTGNVCVSRAPSQNSLSAGGFRWAIHFLDINDVTFGIQVDAAGLDFSGVGSLTANFITTNSNLSDWVPVDGDMSMCTTRSAVYTSGSGSKQLGFKFNILPGDTVGRLDISNLVGAELIFPSPEDDISLLVNSPGTSAITVDPNIEGISLPSDQIISIDTTPPSVVSIIPQTSTTPDGTYAVGDSLFFLVLFDKPVEVDIGLELILNTESGVARYLSGSGTETLVLQYIVEEGDATPDLDTITLIAQNTEGGRSPVVAHVRRKSLSPTTDANLDIIHIANVAENYDLRIDGSRPRLLSVSFDGSDQGNTFERGDSLAILVEFSAPVVVNESSPPILGLNVGTNERWATYSSGSGSSTLRFSYTVVVGDSSAPLEFYYRRFCQESGDCINTEGLIVRLSATLELDADTSTGFSDTGLQIAASPETGVTTDTSQAPVTAVESTTTPKAGGTYGVGEIVDIRVKFTDQVFLPGSMPTLLLNTGNSASYHSGKETDTLTFRLVSTEVDSSSRLDWALHPATNSAISCTNSCTIENANGVAADIRFHDPDNSIDLVQPLEPMIVLDPSPPQIVSVTTDKMKSPYCHPSCTYTVGEEIEIIVMFDRPVVVQGNGVFLTMDVGDDVENNRAVYVSQSAENKLVFLYTVGHGHSSDGSALNYVCPGSSLDLGAATNVKGAASMPTTDADLTLPPCSEHGLSGDALNPILVDTGDQTNVVGVSSMAPDGVYSPGDTIEISVQFSGTVVVSGDPFLILYVGKPHAGTASYKGGSGSPALLFEYEVGLDHSTLDLGYVDAHSLHLGFDGVNSGSIKQASTNPTVEVNLDLPLASGSLGANSDIKIDSRKPFVSSILATPGEYSTSDTISITLQFSRPVTIDGIPSLVLNTGLGERTAAYSSQPNDRSMTFSYTVQLGDDIESLDYLSDEELLPSSRMSLRLNGGWIKLKGAKPVLDADLHINPIDGFLEGNKVVQVTEGVALFRDLKIGQRGKDFQIWYQSNVPSTGGDLQVAEMIQIDASIEYEVLGDLTNRDPGDRFGSAVAIQGGILAVGAPGKRSPTPEIQVLTVFCETSVAEHEHQLIETSVNRGESVVSSQEFSTCADVGATIHGSFSLTYHMDGAYAFASPLKFDSDVSADQLKSVLEQELNLIGLIATSKVSNLICESHNAWTWSVTFLDSSEGVGVLETNGDFLAGNGAHISQSVPTRDVDMLRGSFQLVNPFNGLISRGISYDASSNAVKDAIEEDLAISVLSVQAENMDSDHEIAELGRRWTVIFSHHIGEYGQDTNVPQLQATSDGLLGKDSRVWTHTGYEGRGILSGSFALSFRDSDPSHFVSHDASEADIAAALESLDSINEVSVSARRMFSDEVGKSGFSWTITFNSVNMLTKFGWLLDPGGASSHGNFPAIEVTSHLIGWNAGYDVQRETGRGEEDTQAQWMVQEMGDDGAGSGLVDIFRKVRETWRKEGTVLPADYNSNDSFGASVSIADGYLLVGAPSKEVDGLPEQQTMTCNGPATEGFFFVNFRGFGSSAIPHDATLVDIQNSVMGLYGGTDNIHSTPRLLMSGSEGWDGVSSGFCDGSANSISITFLTPDGGGISTIEKRSDDLEEISVDASNLIGAFISLHEHRAGTVAPTGKDLNNSQPTGKQSGSAYLFASSLSCRYCEPVWTQVMKFTPMDGMDSPTDTAEFGQSSVFVPGADPTSHLVIISSPGFFHTMGKVYIFHVVQSSWVLLDSLTDQNWNHERITGVRFGGSLDADSDTILVGSPGHSNGKGAVYVFRRSMSERGKPFLASQAIYGPDDLSDGDGFGHSIALSNNKAVLCAPHKTTTAIHLSMLPQQPRQAGACYIYSREDQLSAFKLVQQLTPSNILSGDRFGWSVAMMSNRIVVGQIEEFGGKKVSPRPVQVIETYCENSPCKNAAASTFRLQWSESTSWTSYISASATANQLREVVEADLLSGAASVSRSVLPDIDGGHMWRITFDPYASIFRDVNKIPAIHCEAFVTSSLSCKTHIEHDIPGHVRGKAHLFDFDESGEAWIEQAFLFSSAPQRQDLLATSVAIDGDSVVAGAPNRELLNINSGAAAIYNIRFLYLNFPDGPYSLTEGDIVNINVERSGVSLDQKQFVSLRTMDPNADDAWMEHINELFSLRSLDLVSHDRTPVELLTANSAMGRSNFYGSHEKRSLFIRGLYDVQGINDYELLDFQGQLNEGEDTITTNLKITDDDIRELDENVTIQFNMRGMFASQLGRLKTDIQIMENGDGVSPEGSVKYQVLDGPSHEELARTGAAVDIDRAAGMLIVGSDKTTGVDTNGNRFVNVGSADIFKRTSTGSWDFMATLTPPIGETEANMYFGQSAAINKPYGRDDVTVLIGAPGAAAAFVYAFRTDWMLQDKLIATDATLSAEDEYAGHGAIALHEDMAFIGSSTMESVYVFCRHYIAGQGFVNWNPHSILRSSDFDFDMYGHGFSIKHMHIQGFGMALAAKGRSLLVGAPHADYGNRGETNVREYYDTNGLHNKGLGKGRVYAFYSQPHVQTITLQSDEKIQAGSFTLKLNNHRGVEEDVSGTIAHDSTPDLLKVTLEEMLTIGEVNVESGERIETDSYEMRWRISFLSDFADDHPLLVPQWHGNGCDDCERFKVSVLSTVEPFMTALATHSHQPYIQEGEMQPRDVTSTDLFGASLSLDGPQAIIGSMHGAAKTRTTWNFETGDLQGWSATGTAFRFQPTFGDSSKFRAVYEGYGTAASHTSGEPQGSRLVGRYYIASYDMRPGVQDGSYQVPNQSHNLGSIQGDGPTGTLTSDPFIIRGKTISFLIGGGCNHLTTFVELLVDGYPSLRATGKCSERMSRVHWDVDMFQSRAGQIRIVDNGSNKWDHINIDDINFSWHMGMGGTCQMNNFGQCAEGGGTLPKMNSPSEKQHYTGREESPMSGAAYMFLYECDRMDLYDLAPSNSNCAWVEQERLVASDKREGNLFGISVDVDHEKGVAIIGSSNAPAYGFYQEPVSVHPHSNSTMDLPIPEDLEDMMKSGITYSATGGNVRLLDYLTHQGNIAIKEASKYTEHAGVTYVFLREPAKLGPTGEIIQKPFWRTTEHSKIAPPDVAARDRFGFSVALDGTTAVMGATGRDGHTRNRGGAFVYDMEWVRVKFSKVEFVALEGQRGVKIFVERDLSWSGSRFSIGYSTSDLTAIGVDTYKYNECMNGFPSPDRDGCGDYEQSSGEVTFNPGEQHAYFTIRIMDDRCIEQHMEYVQLNLHQIGGSPLRGENFRAQLRIDDDDWPHDALSVNCVGGIG